MAALRRALPEKYRLAPSGRRLFKTDGLQSLIPPAAKITEIPRAVATLRDFRTCWRLLESVATPRGTPIATFAGTALLTNRQTITTSSPTQRRNGRRRASSPVYQLSSGTRSVPSPPHETPPEFLRMGAAPRGFIEPCLLTRFHSSKSEHDSSSFE